MKLAWLALLLAISTGAEARVFNYKDAEVAAYVRGTGGLSLLDQDMFANAAGNGGVSIDGASKYNYGAEVGFALAMGPNTHLRVGAEIIQENPVAGTGSSASGTKLYDLTSTVFVFNPNIAFERVWSTSGALRYYFSLGAGYAMVTGSNEYKLTSAGVSTLGAASADVKESMTAAALSGEAALGLETLFTDNATVMADFGYRYLPVKTLKYSSDGQTFSGSYSKGDIVLNSDGSKRTLNLGGLFVGVAFRFYLNFM